ncbi:hypothetical protein DFJ73DRAFT_896714 [Zopfochytrium polystomum]|nr:hypothetical protein DFJ73DRAFT_896714 [Zopfochytrium polystomum]
MSFLAARHLACCCCCSADCMAAAAATGAKEAGRDEGEAAGEEDGDELGVDVADAGKEEERWWLCWWLCCWYRWWWRWLLWLRIACGRILAVVVVEVVVGGTSVVVAVDVLGKSEGRGGNGGSRCGGGDGGGDGAERGFARRDRRAVVLAPRGSGAVAPPAISAVATRCAGDGGVGVEDGVVIVIAAVVLNSEWRIGDGERERERQREGQGQGQRQRESPRQLSLKRSRPGKQTGKTNKQADRQTDRQQGGACMKASRVQAELTFQIINQKLLFGPAPHGAKQCHLVSSGDGGHRVFASSHDRIAFPRSLGPRKRKRSLRPPLRSR